MLRNIDPWTPYQKSLLAVAVVLGFCCLMAEMLNELRPYVNTQNPQNTAATLIVFPR
jgi:hypothetical protein